MAALDMILKSDQLLGSAWLDRAARIRLRFCRTTPPMRPNPAARLRENSRSELLDSGRIGGVVRQKSQADARRPIEPCAPKS